MGVGVVSRWLKWYVRKTHHHSRVRVPNFGCTIPSPRASWVGAVLLTSYPTWGRELISQVLFTSPTVSVPQVNLFASAEVTWVCDAAKPVIKTITQAIRNSNRKAFRATASRWPHIVCLTRSLRSSATPSSEPLAHCSARSHHRRPKADTRHCASLCMPPDDRHNRAREHAIMLSAQQTQQQISPSAHLSESTAPPRACIMQLLIFPTQARAASSQPALIGSLAALSGTTFRHCRHIS